MFHKNGASGRGLCTYDAVYAARALISFLVPPHALAPRLARSGAALARSSAVLSSHARARRARARLSHFYVSYFTLYSICSFLLHFLLLRLAAVVAPLLLFLSFARARALRAFVVVIVIELQPFMLLFLLRRRPNEKAKAEKRRERRDERRTKSERFKPRAAVQTILLVLLL